MCRRPGGVDFGGVQGVVGCQDSVAVTVVVDGGGHGVDGQDASIVSPGADRCDYNDALAQPTGATLVDFAVGR